MEELYEGMTDSEKKIFKAAIEIFSQKGYSAATTKDIARTAGVAEGTIFRYYKTKKDILNVIMLKLVDILSTWALRPVEELLKNTQGKDLKQIFRAILVDRMKLFDKIYPMASVVFTEVLFKEDIRNAIYNKLYKRGEAAFTEFYKAAGQSGLIRADLPADAVFRMLFANIALYIAGKKLFPEKLNPDEEEREYDILFDMILNGIAV